MKISCHLSPVTCHSPPASPVTCHIPLSAGNALRPRVAIATSSHWGIKLVAALGTQTCVSLPLPPPASAVPTTGDYREIRSRLFFSRIWHSVLSAVCEKAGLVTRPFSLYPPSRCQQTNQRFSFLLRARRPGPCSKKTQLFLEVVTLKRCSSLAT